MKTRFLVMLASAALLSPLPGAEDGGSEEIDDWAAYEALMRNEPPATYDLMSPRERLEYYDDRWRKISAASLAYFENHPDDPRRWQAVLQFITSPPVFLLGFEPGYDDNPSPDYLLIDQAAKAAWEERKQTLKAAVAAAPDVPESVRQALEAEEIRQVVLGASGQRRVVEIDTLGARVRDHVEKFDNPAAVATAEMFGVLIDSVAPERRVEVWTRFLDSSNQAVAQCAAERLRAFAMLEMPLDLRFTALDGREVDLAALRGKVVLIEFWAMWCGPCVSELPFLKRAYATYHGHGFEIIGISLDDPDEREEVRRFIERNELPWLHYFADDGWKSEIRRRFAVAGVPATFLLNQEGRVVTTKARGPALEYEVRRLLGL